MLKRYFRILVAGFSLLSGGLAHAGTTTIGVTPGTGESYQVITNGSGNYVGEMGVCDGTAAAQCAAVKAASTAAGATDPALVVAISPNNTVAVTESGAWTVQPGNTPNTTAWLFGLNTTPSLANGNGVVPTQGGSVLSATNGLYSNLLQGNAVLSATNGLFVAPTTAATWTVEPGNTANTTPWLMTINQGSNSAAVVTGSTTPTTSNPALVVSLSPSTNGLTPTATGQNQTPPSGWLMMGAEFNTSPTTITPGNASPLQVDSAGNLLVNVKTGGGSGGTSSSFGSAFPGTGTAIGLTNGTNMVAWSASSNYGTSPGAIAVPAVNADVTNTVAENITQVGGATISATNGLYVLPTTAALFPVNLTQVSSTVLGTPVSWGSTPSGIVIGANVNCITGCSASGTTFAQGGATAPTNAGLAGGTYNSSALSLSNGQSAALQVNNEGYLLVSGVGVAEATAVGSLTFSPLGAEGLSTEKTAVTTGDFGRLVSDLVGKLIVMPYAPNQLWVSGEANATGTGATTIIASAGGSLKNYIKSVQCARDDAGTTAIRVTFNDAAASELVLPNNGGGGGNNVTFDPPVTSGAATAFTFTSSASTTTVRCNAQGYTGT
jgi:hypothetical protein